MILFFGTRPGKTQTHRMLNVDCPFCNQTGTLVVSRQSTYFHLFWIKLFKISSNTVAECDHCKRVYYEDEFSEPMLKSLEK